MNTNLVYPDKDVPVKIINLKYGLKLYLAQGTPQIRFINVKGK